jgi:hypothetical protein
VTGIEAGPLSSCPHCAGSHRRLYGASHRVDHAGELNESTVPGILDDASAILGEFGIEKRPSQSF